ncbi:cadmium-translocating P-type ATPase [Polynucleobacter sp. 71A-WALBACH]|jgi:Cd2+/Zn2+-exporting ATPase|uniref:heavy metal translocating P-type ATPase n=1 Tax=unclassified Polynucleobacter TaxID=2640945 RepID=UPI001BFEB290|nr:MULTISPECIES: heavy metal translocating P-type ATPase [unclassified Polynucleobacter]MBU3593458.1 cadmium-translocating P-type ATPase [Polynucleobacter sp. 71A-WALBACH]MBU3602065.1 cadmium-translocating P-type ATPase [Polynucleobacter sp. AM-25C3]QWD65505.1 cadmium-translocating P-type ATPase [Polynucleobacter sp. MWH-Aus1W21]
MSECNTSCSCSTSTPVTKASEIPSKNKAIYRIENMDCPTEEALIRKKLASVSGIESLDFNLMQRMLTVGHNLNSLDAIESALGSIGMQAVLQIGETSTKDSSLEPMPKTNWWPLAIAGITATLAEIMELLQLGNQWIVIALVIASIASGGLTTYKKGWIALKNGNLNINALMSIAVTGAMAIGSWPEAAMVMFLFTLAEVIEAKSLDRARNAIRGLLDLTPETATVQQADGSWVLTDVKAIALGALVRVRPGERIALDGILISGNSAVNQAPITGESLPVDKIVGDEVFAGTINQTGSFEYKVTAEATHSTLARIIHAVEAAQGSRAPTQRFVDQFAKIYTPAVFLLAVLVAVLPPLLMAQSWQEWIYKALVMLVIACPCALVISTPVTIVSGLAAAARKGILIKGGAFLEAGRSMKVLAVDKTGTLTYGKPAQTDFFALSSNDKHIHEIAISLAARSDHPVSLAIAHANQEQKNDLKTVDSFEAILGRGVKGVIEGNLYYLGNHRLIEELGLCSDDIENRLLPLEQQGKTAVLLTNQTEVLAIIAVADTVRETSKQAIDELHQLGVTTIMLTGDNEHTAKAIGKQVGVDEIMGNLLPEDKLKIIDSRLKKDPNVKVGMVGDGINDAPALARASIGFAMGAAGTDTAIETADVALMDDDLRKIATFIRLSKSTALILTQNIVLALGIKAIFLVLTFTGQATMWMAVFADMGASLLVVANGLRLLRS